MRSSRALLPAAERLQLWGQGAKEAFGQVGGAERRGIGWTGLLAHGLGGAWRVREQVARLLGGGGGARLRHGPVENGRLAAWTRDAIG